MAEKQREETMSDNMIPIILCAGSEGRAVLYGRVETEPEAGQPIRLHGARMILYWAGSDGLFGVAANGPDRESRLTPVVGQVYETTWLSWLSVTEQAAERIEGWS